MRISDWSSDVCSSDLGAFGVIVEATFKIAPLPKATQTLAATTADLASASALALHVWDASPALRALTVLSPSAAALAGLSEAPAEIPRASSRECMCQYI